MVSLSVFSTALLAFASAADQSISGGVNQIVDVSLPGDTTPGYQWMIEEIPSQLVFLESQIHSTRCAPGVVCPASTVFKFFAKAGGDGTLKVLYGTTKDQYNWEEKDVPVHIEFATAVPAI